MDSRKEEKATVKPFSWGSFAIGTLSGTGTRWALLFSEKVYTDASLASNTKSYAQLYRENLKFKSLYQINSIFFKTCLMQTFAKSASNIGVMYATNHSFSHYSATQKGLIAAFSASSLETLTTSYHECKRVQAFLKMRDPEFKMTPHIGYQAFARTVSATYMRAAWSGVATFVPMNIAQEKLAPVFIQYGMSNAHAKSLATLVSSFSVQPLIMPVLNFQTHVLSDPTVSFSKSAHSFFRDKKPKDYMRGTLGRCINRGLYYPVVDGMSHWLHSLITWLDENVRNHQKNEKRQLKMK